MYVLRVILLVELTLLVVMIASFDLMLTVAFSTLNIIWTCTSLLHFKCYLYFF